MTIFLYITSNNQLTRLVYQVLSRSGKCIPKKGWVFDNGTVIKIKRNSDGSITVEMIHPIAVSDAVRFVSLKDFNDAFEGIVVFNVPLNSVIFLIRHGHAGHNERTASIEEAHDAHLTEKGIEQAVKAGQAIRADPDVASGEHELFIYCSDLLRTMQTAKNVSDQLPEEIQPKFVTVLIQAREYSRPIGGEHYWEDGDLRIQIAMDPFLPIEELRVLAAGKTDPEIRRMVIENLPKNDPIRQCAECIKEIDGFQINWTRYIDVLTKGTAEGKTFGQIASETSFLDVIIENAMECERLSPSARLLETGSDD
jgi:hypothetical protein